MNLIKVTNPKNKIVVNKTDSTIKVIQRPNKIIVKNVGIQGARGDSVLTAIRGDYDASISLFPTTGGSGAGGQILAEDKWLISVNGVIAGKLYKVGDLVIARVNTPLQVSANWYSLSEALGFVAENALNKENNILDYSATKYPTLNLLKTSLDNLSVDAGSF